MNVLELQTNQSIHDILKAASECKNKVGELCQLLLTIQKQKEAEFKAEVTKLDSVLLKILEIKKQKELELRNIKKQKEAELKAEAQKMTSVLTNILDLKINAVVKDIKNPVSLEAIGSLLKKNSLTIRSLIDKCEQFGVASELFSMLSISKPGYSVYLLIKGQTREYGIPLIKDDFQHLIQTFEKSVSIDELCQNKDLLVYIFKTFKTLSKTTFEQHSKVFEALLKNLVCSFRQLIDKCLNNSSFAGPLQIDQLLRNTKLFKNLIDNNLISILDIKYILNALSSKLNIDTDARHIENCSKSLLNNSALMTAIFKNHLFRDLVDSFKELSSLDQLISWLNKESSEDKKIFNVLLEKNLISNADLKYLIYNVKTQNDIRKLNAEIDFMTYLVKDKVCTIQDLAEAFERTSESNHSNLVKFLCNTEFFSQLIESNSITNKVHQTLWTRVSSYGLSTALANGTLSQLPKSQYISCVKLCLSHANSIDDLQRLSTPNCLKAFCDLNLFESFIKKCVGRRKDPDRTLKVVVSEVESLLRADINYKGFTDNDLKCFIKELGSVSLERLIKKAPLLLNKLLVENVFDKEFAELSSDRLANNFFEVASEFFKYQITSGSQIPRAFETFELLKIYQHTCTFEQLEVEDKKKLINLIEHDDDLRSKVNYLIDNNLENTFEDFDSLKVHLTKKKKLHSLNI